MRRRIKSHLFSRQGKDNELGGCGVGRFGNGSNRIVSCLLKRTSDARGYRSSPRTHTCLQSNVVGQYFVRFFLVVKQILGVWLLKM